MTNKKTYTKPSLQVVMLDCSDLIATSNPRSSVSLRFDLEEEEDEGYAD